MLGGASMRRPSDADSGAALTVLLLSCSGDAAGLPGLGVDISS
jgi:hypothetical protein